MGTRNVYVSAEDAALFDRAAELAGSLSAAVVAGLRMYIAQREREEGAERMHQVEVEVTDGPLVGVKRFTGRRILRYEDREATRVRTYRVYATARGGIAVACRDDPDWRALSSTREDDPAWNDPGTWSGDWWHSGQRSLQVFPDAAAMTGILPDALVTAIENALNRPAVEDLDI